MSDRYSLAGKTFGKLKVISAGLRKADGAGTSVCLCECGNKKTIRNASLRSGRTRSCGCLTLIHGHFKGHIQSRTYRSWATMIQRCFNPKNPYYYLWGGRGIKVCDRWRKFQNFLADMGHRPVGKTLDRKDTNGNYEPTNCRWATPLEQARNSRWAKRLTIAGFTGCLSELAEHFGIQPSTMKGRIRMGWPLEQVFEISEQK
jgi:hypothetical protein